MDDSVNQSIYDVESSDPESRLIDRSAMPQEEVVQIGRLMAALGRLRDAEDRLTEASLNYMKLNRTDMRALHYLIAIKNRGEIATPGMIAIHLGISSASVTKLLDRLEHGNHIVREPHPSDRRALAITITDETHEAAVNTVGRQHAKRFHAAARLTPKEREAVIRFLDDMAREITAGTEAWAAEAER